MGRIKTLLEFAGIKVKQELEIEQGSVKMIIKSISVFVIALVNLDLCAGQAGTGFCVAWYIL